MEATPGCSSTQGSRPPSDEVHEAFQTRRRNDAILISLSKSYHIFPDAKTAFLCINHSPRHLPRGRRNANKIASFPGAIEGLVSLKPKLQTSARQGSSLARNATSPSITTWKWNNFDNNSTSSLESVPQIHAAACCPHVVKLQDVDMCPYLVTMTTWYPVLDYYNSGSRATQTCLHHKVCRNVDSTPEWLVKAHMIKDKLQTSVLTPSWILIETTDCIC